VIGEDDGAHRRNSRDMAAYAAARCLGQTEPGGRIFRAVVARGADARIKPGIVALGYDELELLVLPQEGELHGGCPRFLIPEPIKQGMELRAECGSRHAARRLFFSLRLVAPGARGGTNESGVGTKRLLN